jgi:hypothetical protein
MVCLVYVCFDRCFANGNARLCRAHRILVPFEPESEMASRLVVAWHRIAARVLRTCGSRCDFGLTSTSIWPLIGFCALTVIRSGY